MAKHHISADWIFEQTIKQIAPLPCQEEYMKQLASIMSFHLHRNELLDMGMDVDELPVLSAVVVAPTGQRKTFLLRKMAEAAHINIITVDGSSLSAEGWRGVALGQRILSAREQIKDDTIWSRSILFIDEVDKMRFWGTQQDQGNPTNNLLQLFNGGYYAAEDNNKNVVNINVRRFTVLLGGAFSGIDEIISERVAPKGQAGFLASENRVNRTTAELLQMVTLDDLKKYGMSQELLGRIGSVLTIPPLSFDDYSQLLSASTGSIRSKYNNYLRELYGVTFDISDAGTRTIAERCMKLNTGARAVNPMINDLMRTAIAEVERNQQIYRVILDADENGHTVRYEYGERDGGMYNQKNADTSLANNSEPVCKIRAKCFPAMVNKLCRYYKNAGGAAYREPELKAFLNCALLYVFENIRKEDHNFDSLLKLAKTIDRKGKNRSTFEILMEPKVGQHNYYVEFQGYYHPNLHQHLQSSLMVIRKYMIEKNGDVKFHLELKNKQLD